MIRFSICNISLDFIVRDWVFGPCMKQIRPNIIVKNSSTDLSVTQWNLRLKLTLKNKIHSIGSIFWQPWYLIVTYYQLKYFIHVIFSSYENHPFPSPPDNLLWIGTGGQCFKFHYKWKNQTINFFRAPVHLCTSANFRVFSTCRILPGASLMLLNKRGNNFNSQLSMLKFV